MCRFVFSAFVLLLVIGSCTNELDLIHPHDPIPVVYFQMNPVDHYYYLTLTKSFVGDSNAYDMARNPDLFHYDSAEFYLEGWVDDYKIWEGRFERCERGKDTGIFSEIPGYCYSLPRINTTMPFHKITQFRLIGIIPGMSSPMFSRIGIVGEPMVKSRYDHQIWLYPGRYKIEIAPGPGSAYCDLVCVFRYKEFVDSWVNYTDTFLLRKDINFEAGQTDYLYADLFFTKLATRIKPAGDTIVRKFTSLDLVFFAADQYFRDYMETYQNAGNIDLPPKGNITNGYGLFTMVRKAVKDSMVFDRVTLDSLCFGEITKNLGFVKW